MTTLQDTLQDTREKQILCNTILRLTNDLDAVVGIRALSPTTAEIWISAPGVEETVRTRCAEFSAYSQENNKPDPLQDLKLVFRDELQPADTQGGAAEKPRPQEPREHGNPEHPGGEGFPFPYATTSEVE